MDREAALRSHRARLALWHFTGPGRTLFGTPMRRNSGSSAPDPQVIQTAFGDFPTPLGLPDDLLQQASHRLGIMCLVMSGLWAANVVLTASEVCIGAAAGSPRGTFVQPEAGLNAATW